MWPWCALLALSSGCEGLLDSGEGGGVIVVGRDDARAPATDAAALPTPDAALPDQFRPPPDPEPTCGDGTCNGTEACDTCPADCGPCAPGCGDGTCNGTEACNTCPADCGACPARCGDGTCDANESCGTCADDCGACPARCGDGTCDASETCGDCPDDCGACDWPEPLARSEDELLVLVNRQREVGANCGGTVLPPAGPLRMVSGLREAARAHSLDMGEHNYFDHTGLDGSNFSQRVARTDYTGFAGGENIAAGNGGAQATFNQWLTSPGHCRNMLAARFDEIGVGHAEVRGSQYTHYWTQVLGEGR